MINLLNRKSVNYAHVNNFMKDVGTSQTRKTGAQNAAGKFNSKLEMISHHVKLRTYREKPRCLCILGRRKLEWIWPSFKGMSFQCS